MTTREFLPDLIVATVFPSLAERDPRASSLRIEAIEDLKISFALRIGSRT